MLQAKFMSTSCETALRWMPQNTFNDQSTLVQVMAWCCQATSHYLSQCWSRSMSPYGVNRLECVNTNDDIKGSQRNMVLIAQIQNFNPKVFIYLHVYSNGWFVGQCSLDMTVGAAIFTAVSCSWAVTWSLDCQCWWHSLSCSVQYFYVIRYHTHVKMD